MTYFVYFINGIMGGAVCGFLEGKFKKYFYYLVIILTIILVTIAPINEQTIGGGWVEYVFRMIGFMPAFYAFRRLGEESNKKTK